MPKKNEKTIDSSSQEVYNKLAASKYKSEAGHWYSKDGDAGGIDPTCKLCRKAQCSLKHILVGCQCALQQDRYTWRHDSVLFRIYKSVRALRDEGRKKFFKCSVSKRICDDVCLFRNRPQNATHRNK